MEWGPFENFKPAGPYKWPQDTLQIPGLDGGGGRFMPPVEIGNVQVARQEAFTMSTSFTWPINTPANTQYTQIIPTDQDGDFWCDQIYMVAWLNNPGGVYQSVRPAPSTIAISDLRTGKQLTYPGAVPTNFFTTLLLFSDDAGFDPGGSPLPDGFRSTSTLPQPFCFTRQGGISLQLNMIAANGAGQPQTIDIAFGGWKEYTYAST